MTNSQRARATSVSTFLAEIPAAAWHRPIGLPLERPGKPCTAYPIVDDGHWQGAPLGGIGAGTIGRTYRGDFARWHLYPGYHHYEPRPACMFSIFLETPHHRLAQALWTAAPERCLNAWQWRYPVGTGSYYALYPRSWFVYEWEQFQGVRISVEQFSPILPHNYRESSFPIALFLWTVENPLPEPVTVGVLFTWESAFGLGYPSPPPNDFTLVHTSKSEPLGTTGQMVGLILRGGHAPAVTPWEGSFALAALATSSVEVTLCPYFNASGDGAEIWHDFADDGRLDNREDKRTAYLDEHPAGGVAATVTLAPNETQTVPFVLAWDLPIVEFGAGDRWHRRYTVFFDTSGQNAWSIAREGLIHYRAWRDAIVTWQRPILEDRATPLWYKTALFNELYFVADGATAWVVDPERPEEIGHFAQIECYDYPFYETLDVRFYGSFPIAMLWPELEKRVMYDFIPTVFLEDTSPHPIESTGRPAPRKLAGAVPHDLGAPNESPWRRPNAYTFQDTNSWKDLNSKFVLLIYRDYVLTGDRCLLEASWPAVRLALDYLKRFDRDNDGLPENENFPDQTYDTWPMLGASAYCGGLWLAALEAARKIARLLNDQEAFNTYTEWLVKGRLAFEHLLWNGRYFRYDTQSPHRESIMADQLAGQWYADLTNLPPLVSEEKITQALRTVFEYNVCQFAGGRMGAVNGMRPDGTVDTSSNQAEEVWSGVTYAIASAMLLRGLDEEAWRTAWGAYHVTYEARGFWFRTPEAWDAEGNFRASMYLRPGAIWAIQLALERRRAR